MNRLIKCLIIIFTSLILLLGCSSGEVDSQIKTKKSELNDGNEYLSVDIITSKSEIGIYDNSIELTPVLNIDYNKELQYHWILESEYDFLGFYIEEQGPQMEIINKGESVELALFTEVSWVPDAYEEISVKLQVEEKESGEIVAKKEIKIENYSGLYKVIAKEETILTDVPINTDKTITPIPERPMSRII